MAKSYSVCNISEDKENVCKETNPFDFRSRDKFTVLVEGNIGCGKSTFLRHFDGCSPNLEVIQEPVALWTDLKSTNLLELMYTDPKRWCTAFQSYVQLTVSASHTKKQSAPVKLMERSIYSARYCFIENAYKNDVMTDMDYHILDEWFEWNRKRPNLTTDLIIYLKAEPEVCLDRIKKRNRHEETSIPLDYLRQLHELHESWLIDQTLGELPAPVLVINTELPLDELKKVYDQHRSEVLCGLE